jgi:hypothetical protein
MHLLLSGRFSLQLTVYLLFIYIIVSYFRAHCDVYAQLL